MAALKWRLKRAWILWNSLITVINNHLSLKNDDLHSNVATLQKALVQSLRAVI